MYLKTPVLSFLMQVTYFLNKDEKLTKLYKWSYKQCHVLETEYQTVKYENLGQGSKAKLFTHFLTRERTSNILSPPPPFCSASITAHSLFMFMLTKHFSKGHHSVLLEFWHKEVPSFPLKCCSPQIFLTSPPPASEALLQSTPPLRTSDSVLVIF